SQTPAICHLPADSGRCAWNCIYQCNVKAADERTLFAVRAARRVLFWLQRWIFWLCEDLHPYSIRIPGGESKLYIHPRFYCPLTQLYCPLSQVIWPITTIYIKTPRQSAYTKQNSPLQVGLTPILHPRIQ
ncbi:MAG TPA: hypothetical protein VIG80_05140, partial [Bacillaceae bacterium]